MVKKKEVTKEISQKEEKPSQLTLGLKSPMSNVFFDLKGKLVSRFNLFGANTFINDPYVWLLVTLQIVGLFYQLIYILNNLNSLPSILPLLSLQTITSASLTPKLYFLLFPVVSFLIFSITFRNARSNYFRNQFLALYILFLGNLINITLCMHIIKVISQYV